jgi:CBS domain-containing protein
MLRARDIMTTTIQTVTMRMSIHDLAQLLTTQHISGVPVLSDDGAVIGVVTEADLLSKTGATVGEIMTSGVTSVAEETPIQEIGRILGRLKITRVPVMRGEALVGIVSRGDIVRAMAYTDQAEKLIRIEGC